MCYNESCEQDFPSSRTGSVVTSRGFTASCILLSSRTHPARSSVGKFFILRQQMAAPKQHALLTIFEMNLEMSSAAKVFVEMQYIGARD